MNKTFEDYQRRVINEKVELDTRLKKLQAFLKKDIEIANDELDRLNRQLEAMTRYSRILGERIKAF